MSRYVIDANVAVKWFLPLRAEEIHLEQALHLLNLFSIGEVDCYQPPHFRTEVMGVITRLRPEQTQATLVDLLNMDFKFIETPNVYTTACDLAIELKHHLFDTLYHAVALHTPGAQFVTADEAYYRKAQDKGQIQLLRDITT